MDAQVETGILQVARCCFRKVQARRRDLRTLGFCSVSQCAAGCPDLISGGGPPYTGQLPAGVIAVPARSSFCPSLLPSQHAAACGTRYVRAILILMATHKLTPEIKIG